MFQKVTKQSLISRHGQPLKAFSVSFGAKIQIVLRFDNRMQQNKILRIEFSYGVVGAKKGAQIGFFSLSWSVMQNTAKNS